MNRTEIKEFLETLHFHGYIDHDVTKLDSLIDDYYPKQCDKADVIKSVCAHDWVKKYYKDVDYAWQCIFCGEIK